MPKTVFAVLPAQSRFLESTKRNLSFDLNGTIDLHSSGLKFLADSHGAIYVLSENGS